MAAYCTWAQEVCLLVAIILLGLGAPAFCRGNSSGKSNYNQNRWFLSSGETTIPLRDLANGGWGFKRRERLDVKKPGPNFNLNNFAFKNNANKEGTVSFHESFIISHGCLITYSFCFQLRRLTQHLQQRRMLLLLLPRQMNFLMILMSLNPLLLHQSQ